MVESETAGGPDAIEVAMEMKEIGSEVGIGSVAAKDEITLVEGMRRRGDQGEEAGESLFHGDVYEMIIQR